ncbi:ABC transporter ATP-binding protein [Cryomorpha ignava]|uniref:ABC transporter ATP-binding protein n=2 Tax=Cryomorpha ignava TaxID=101383 RepID=A0A7K3WLD0_9FLAO|nr:ATP-binding cassette domain-containing protein [Cryomorpha ignava]NEN22447.1 ABC transporter ATP-binding protein [Cryomorpha ignava]
MDVLKVENITKAYANHIALNDVSLSVPKGSIYGLLGPNGAGKTTLIRIVNQITGPDSGKVFFNGEPLSPKHVSRIGYLPEERGLYKKMKVGEQALYLAQLKGMSKKDANEKLKEWFKRFEIEGWWDKKVEELSKGMAQKVQFITTVMHEPEFIILDEPFSGFDPINANLIKGEIKRLSENGTTIMLSTHNMGSVEEICSHIGLIHNSVKMLEGSIGTVRDAYKEGVYDLQFQGDMISITNAMWTNFELIDHWKRDGSQIARIKLLNKSTVNDLLAVAIAVIKVEAVNEVIPSMNDIFIKVVENKSDSHE